MRGVHFQLLGKAIALAAGGILSLTGGCQSQQPASGPPQVRPAQTSDAGARREEKPLPDPTRSELPPPPYADFPLINQRPPEQTEFLRAYEGVGRPRIAVFVNRTLQAQAQNSWDRRGDGYGAGREYEVSLAEDIDYSAIETVLTQWLSCDGQVTVMSPSVIRARLKPEEVSRLEQGRLRELREIAKELDADILVQVQVRPTRQSAQGGTAMRLNAESINLLGGESIGRATVLIPPPLSSEQINKFTRFVARKLMNDMILSWSGPGPGARPREGGVPQTEPVGPRRDPLPPTPPREGDVPPRPPEQPAPAPGGAPGDPPPVPPPVPGQDRPSILDAPPRRGGTPGGTPPAPQSL